MRKEWSGDSDRYVLRGPSVAGEFWFEQHVSNGIWNTEMHIPREAMVAFFGEDAVKRLEADAHEA